MCERHNCPLEIPCDKCKEKGEIYVDFNCLECVTRPSCQMCNTIILFDSMREPPKTDYFQSEPQKVSPNTFLLVLDNFDNLINEGKYDESLDKIQVFYRQLDNFLKETGFTFRFLFVTNKFIELPIPKIHLTYPTQEYLTEFVGKVIFDEINEPHTRNKLYEVFGINPQTASAPENDSKLRLIDQNINNLNDYIVSSMMSQVRDFRVMRAVALKFLEYSLSWNIVETKGQSPGSILLNRCNHLSKVFVCNPRIAFRPLPDIVRLMDEAFNNAEGSVASESDTFQTKVTKSELKMAEKNSVDSFSLPQIPSILLIACFIANVSTEKKDLQLFTHASKFKSKKQSKKITMQEEYGVFEKKPAPKERIEFIAQFFLDIVLKKEKHQEENRELLLLHQSTQFIMSYQLLEDHKLLKRICPQGIDEFSSIKFKCECETVKIVKLAENLNIYLDEFVTTH
jgi:hypothetical protein